MSLRFYVMVAVDKLAVKYWKKGSNCVQAVACSILELQGYQGYKNVQIFHEAFEDFGRGFGEGSICGAIVGGIAAIDIVMSQSGYSDDKREVLVERFKESFKDEFHETDCSKLLEEFKTKNQTIDFNNPLRENKCTRIVATATKRAQRLLESSSDVSAAILNRIL